MDSEDTPTTEVQVEAADVKFVELFCYTNELNAEWKVLGLLLGLKMSVLKTIESDNPKNTTACRMEMLHKWLNLKTDPGNPMTILKNVKELMRKTTICKGKNALIDCIHTVYS